MSVMDADLVREVNWAARSGDAGKVVRLLDETPELLSSLHMGESLVHAAAKAGSVQLLQELLDRGLSADIRNELSDGCFGTITPLTRAIRRKGSVEAVRLLLDHGCPVEGYGGTSCATPFIQAAGAGRVDMLRLLAARGADAHAYYFIPDDPKPISALDLAEMEAAMSPNQDYSEAIAFLSSLDTPGEESSYSEGTLPGGNDAAQKGAVPTGKCECALQGLASDNLGLIRELLGQDARPLSVPELSGTVSVVAAPSCQSASTTMLLAYGGEQSSSVFFIELLNDWPLPPAENSCLSMSWPIDWLCQVAQWAQDNPDELVQPVLLSGEDDYQPLSEKTSFCSWLLTASPNLTSDWPEFPLRFYELTALLEDETRFVEDKGIQPFLELLAEEMFWAPLDPARTRPSVLFQRDNPDIGEPGEAEALLQELDSLASSEARE